MNPPDVRGLYDELGQKYDTWTRLPDRLFLDGWRRELLANARGDVLEVAVGAGKNLHFYPEGCRVRGVYFSRSMLDEASLEHVLPRDRALARLAQAITPFARKRVGCNPNRDTLALAREAGLDIVSVRGRARDIILSVVARP